MYEKGYSSWYSSLYSKRETAILAKVCKQYTFLAGDVTRTLICSGVARITGQGGPKNIRGGPTQTRRKLNEETSKNVDIFSGDH